MAGANFRAGYRVLIRGGCPMAARRPAGKGVVGYARQGLIEMLDRSLKEDQDLRMDERLGRIVRIIVEQYDGDVKAFVDSTRYRIEMNRKAEAASDHGDEARLRKCPSTTKTIEKISRAHYS